MFLKVQNHLREAQFFPEEQHHRLAHELPFPWPQPLAHSRQITLPNSSYHHAFAHERLHSKRAEPVKKITSFAGHEIRSHVLLR